MLRLMSQRPKRGRGSAAHVRSNSPSGSPRARDDGETRDPDLDSVGSGEDATDLVKTKSHETLLALQSAIDGLSQSQLLSVKDMVQKAAQPTRAQKSLRLRSIVDEHLQFLLTEDASATYDELWHDLADADARTWTSIFSSFRPPSDLKPDLAEFPFHDLVDFRPKATNHETAEAFKRFPKQQAIDETLKSVADKQVRPLGRLRTDINQIVKWELREIGLQVRRRTERREN